MEYKKFKCPCCGFLTLDEGPHEFDICPVCYWEDDPVQFKDEFIQGGANAISLHEARENYLNIGASEERFIKMVRKPEPEEYIDEEGD